jgi:cholesterol oxidase
VNDFDVIVIGSGFGGSVAALRLVEKGYRVCVLEAGARFEDKDFPKTSWRLRKFLFAPKLGLTGIQRIHALPDVLVLAGAGVGGGSLVYANTLYQPGDDYFEDNQWREIADWKSELSPWFKLAKQMLGVSQNPFFSPSDQAMLDVAREMGVEETFQLAPLGIYFGQDGIDPYFDGLGPKRNGCTNCGACMTGCRFNAKNTLVKNYLALAELKGLKIKPMSTVTSIKEDGDSWIISYQKSNSWLPIKKKLSADQVVIAAGTYNTQKLLHKMKSTKTLTKISPALGKLSRTNSEALVGSIMPNRKIDFSQGAAITSSFQPDSRTHVEPVRYGKGSNAMALLQTVMTDGNSNRWLQLLKAVFTKPFTILKILNIRKWSERTVIALIMQNIDSAITTHMKRTIFGWRLSSRNNIENPNATYIPAANQTAEIIANKYGGVPAGTIGDLIGAPFTAHFVGGCVIGKNDQVGVIDPYHRVWNYPSLHIVDGSSITANLGVNPSLTITAQAERAFSMWPNNGDKDLRPNQNQPYLRIDSIKPRNPIFPK